MDLKQHVQKHMNFVILEESEYAFTTHVHQRDYFEILIFRDGSGKLLLDTTEVEVLRNRFVFISPGQRRKWAANTNTILGYSLQFEQFFISDFFADALFVYRLQYFYNPTLPTHFIANERLFSFKHDIFEEVKNELENYENDSAHLLRSIMYYVLIKLNRYYCNFHDLEYTTQGNTMAFKLKEAIENNFSKMHRVEDYTKLLGISRITLNRLSKNQYKQTISELIASRLLREIKVKLIFTNMSISEIAYSLNFSEPNNLIRFFKKHTSLTPLKYRREKLSN